MRSSDGPYFLIQSEPIHSHGYNYNRSRKHAEQSQIILFCFFQFFFFTVFKVSSDPQMVYQILSATPSQGTIDRSWQRMKLRLNDRKKLVCQVCTGLLTEGKHQG